MRLRVDGAGELEDAVGERRLAVVDVGDDREVADAVHRCVGPRLEYARRARPAWPRRRRGVASPSELLRRRRPRQPHGSVSRASGHRVEHAQSDQRRGRRSAAGERAPSARAETIWPPSAAAERVVEDVPDPVGDAGERRRGDRDPDSCSRSASGSRGRRACARRTTPWATTLAAVAIAVAATIPPTPKGSYSANGDARRDREVERRDRGRHPGPLEAEEGARQEQEEAVEREREGEPEERRPRRGRSARRRTRRAGRSARPSARRARGSPPRPGTAGARSGASRWPSSSAGRRRRGGRRSATASGRSPSSARPRTCPGGACRSGTPCRSPRGPAVGDERPDEAVDGEVDVDQPEADRHRQHQQQDPLDRRAAPVELELEPERRVAQVPGEDRELDHRAGDDADRVGVDLVAPRGTPARARRAPR